MDGIIHITIEAITTHITTEGITIHIAIAGTTIGTGPGLSASTGVQGIIAIGKRVLCAPPLPFSEIDRERSRPRSSRPFAARYSDEGPIRCFKFPLLRCYFEERGKSNKERPDLSDLPSHGFLISIV